MKWLTLIAVACLVSAQQQDNGYFHLNEHHLIYNKEPKHILIATHIGGSSHTRWVLEIGRILADRGHHITYVTRDDQVHLGQAYPEITTVSTGGPVYTTDILTATKGFNFYQITKVVRQFLNKAYGTDIQFYQQLDKKPDYFICDAFNDPCIDTAVQFKVPFAITCTGMLYQDINVPYINGLGTTHHATSEHMTLWERFQHKYVDLIKTLWYIYPELKELDQYRQAYGMTSLGLNRFKQWDNGLKLINTYFGFFPPQIMSPLTHMIGPVITARQRTLSEQEAVFLNTHKRVAYVAFGQIIKPSKHEIELLFSGLLDQMEHQRLDGILWVGLKKQIQTLEAEDPLLVWQFNTTQSGHVIQPPLLSHALFQRHVFMPPWASQFSVLQHSATVLFVSHGGAESANEATFNGVPILVHPYVGDQRLVGRALTLAGVARTHERADCTFELLRQHMNELLVDEDGSVGRNLTRMKTLAQIGSKRKTFAADLVEEHMYVAKEGISEHRHEPSRNMSKIKAMDIDLHAAVMLMLILSGFSLLMIF